MRGVILAGGSGSRLDPLTKYTSKQLLPIYDKPLIYYPLTTLILAGITEILIITTPQHQEMFIALLGDGKQWDISISYVVQSNPEGLPQGLILAEEFLNGDSCAFILGDNLFYGTGLGRTLKEYVDKPGAHIFAHYVSDPERFGVVEQDEYGKILSIEEKPTSPKSSLAITGLYFFDSDAIQIAKNLKKSKRGEYEMVDLLKSYLENQKLNLTVLPRGTAWLDTGTFQSLNDAANFVRIIQENQGFKVGDPGEASQIIRVGTD
jgi:glucose-1-phosphate thymidylyltransferase